MWPYVTSFCLTGSLIVGAGIVICSEIRSRRSEWHAWLRYTMAVTPQERHEAALELPMTAIVRYDPDGRYLERILDDLRS